MDIWVTIKIKWHWLLAAVKATKEQSFRDHLEAADATDLRHKAEIHVQGEQQHEAYMGLKAVQTEIEKDCQKDP